jgi:HK97 gp10 family phage protein
MAVEFLLKDFDLLGRNLVELQRRIDRGILRSITKSTLLVETEIRERQIKKGGFRKLRQLRTWRIPRPKPTSDTVRTRTGALRSSIVSRVEKKKGRWVGTVGSPLDYARFLEEGTKRGTQKPHAIPGALVGSRKPWIIVRVRGAIKARRFMAKGLDAMREKIDDLMAKELAAVIRATGFEERA